jgi:hypothetical protein
MTSKSKSKNTTTTGELGFTPHPCPSPHAAIRNRTEAWGEGAALTAQVKSVRIAVPSARTRVVQPNCRQPADALGYGLRPRRGSTFLCRRCDIKTYGHAPP